MKSDSLVLSDAWQNYYQVVEEMRAEIEATPRFKMRPDHRAQAYQSLMQAQAMAYTQIIAPSVLRPRVYSQTYFHPNIFTVGQCCGDCIYSLLALHGEQTYRVTARIGDVKIMVLQIYSHPHGHPDCKCIGNYDLSEFATNADGTVDIIFSATRHDGNWIPMESQSNFNYVQIRRFFGDWFDDMGDIGIEMLDEPKGYAESSEAAIAERIESAGRLVRYLIKKWTIGLYDMYISGAGGKNKFHYCPGKEIKDFLGTPSTCYIVGAADCANDEAVIVEWDVPNAAYWGLQLGDVWSVQLECVHNQVDINMDRAVIDSDGKFRCVISHRDTGIHNWVELVGGRTEFLIVLRDYKEVGKPVDPPTMKTVKLEELAENLPNDTRTITPEQRRKDIEHRHRGNEHLYNSM